MKEQCAEPQVLVNFVHLRYTFLCMQGRKIGIIIVDYLLEMQISYP